MKNPKVIIKCSELLSQHGSVLSYIITQYISEHYSQFTGGRDNHRRYILHEQTPYENMEITVLLHHTQQSVIVEKAKHARRLTKPM